MESEGYSRPETAAGPNPSPGTDVTAGQKRAGRTRSPKRVRPECTQRLRLNVHGVALCEPPPIPRGLGSGFARGVPQFYSADETPQVPAPDASGRVPRGDRAWRARPRVRFCRRCCPRSGPSPARRCEGSARTTPRCTPGPGAPYLPRPPPTTVHLSLGTYALRQEAQAPQDRHAQAEEAASQEPPQEEGPLGSRPARPRPPSRRPGRSTAWDGLVLFRPAEPPAGGAARRVS